MKICFEICFRQFVTLVSMKFSNSHEAKGRNAIYAKGTESIMWFKLGVQHRWSKSSGDQKGSFNLQIVTLDTHAKRQSPTERDGRCVFFVTFFVIFYRICKKISPQTPCMLF